MLKESGINADECYTTVWRESKYTLFHSPKADRVSMDAMKQATKVMQENHQIVFNATVFGYDALSSNDTSTGESLENHPGFKRMVYLLNAESDDLKWWIDKDGVDIRDYRKGLLWKYIESTDPETMTHKQLVSRVKAWAPVMQLHKNLQTGYNTSGSITEAIEGSPRLDEFDVIKKRRQMTESTTGENDPDALGQFEAFEASVLDALTNISRDYQQQRYNEFLEAETDLCNGIPPQKGMFYVAICRTVVGVGGKPIPKLGGTRRSDPMIRLKELSRSVPYHFELVFGIATFTPFKIEADVHRHFDAHRIRERKGACTEFFDVDLDTIGQYLRAKYPGEVISGPGHAIGQDA